MYLSDKLTVCHLPAIVQDRHKLEFLPLSVRFLDQKYFIAVFFIDPQVLHLNIFDTLFHSIECIDIS